jgi:hypothetical protein
MGLKASDLKHLVYDVFEIDSYASKMGDDKNIVTLSFSVKDKEPAKDLVSFIEKGYDFVLDADVTPGEQSDGTYKVFVEIERNKDVNDQILEIIDGVSKLAEKDSFRFRYYKDFKSKDATIDNLQEVVPVDPENYGITANESNLNNFKNFFNKSYVDSIEMLEETLVIKKKYKDSVAFEFVDFGDTVSILESIEGKFDLMESYPEIMFLTKYIGDYNISKYGDKLVFENGGKALVVKRL